MNNSSTGIVNIPNSLSAFRMLVSPAVIFFLTYDVYWAYITALLLMLLAELSDLFDGMIARSTGQVSEIGKLLDPLSDSFYRISVFLAFVYNGWMPVLMFLIILSRDFIVSYLRVLSQQRVKTLSARSSGKWKAIVQGMAQGGVILLVVIVGADKVGSYEILTLSLLSIATLVTAYSLVDYTYSLYRSW